MKIQVESGKVLRLEFTYFEVDGPPSECQNFDFVKIIDGDGTTLMDKSCGFFQEDPSSSWYFQLPAVITSESNTVEIIFHTDGYDTKTGWSLSWSAVSKK